LFFIGLGLGLVFKTTTIFGKNTAKIVATESRRFS